MIEKNLKKDNLTISLNVLYTKSEKIRFKTKLQARKNILLLMTLKEER